MVLRALLSITTQYERQAKTLPYENLLLKTDKTEEEMLECEFINMCAEKIQAVFKGYLTRKYHRRATQKMTAFIAKCRAAVVGWKTRRVLQCATIE